MRARPLALPRLLRRPVARFVNGFIQPAAGPAVDFAHPPGEPALLPPDALSWQVFKNPLAVAIGGIAAVILELAEPRVRTGVWEHTSFRTAPLPRLQRTGLAAMLTVYGPRGQTEAMIARVNRLHGRVQGTTPSGQDYRADDPELLAWVQATASFAFTEAYHAYVRPLANAERDQLYAEGEVTTRLYGVLNAPTTAQAMTAVFQAMRPRLEPSAIVFDFLDIMRRAPILPSLLRPVQTLLVKGAVDIVPLWAREQLGLLGPAWRLNRAQRWLLAMAGSWADRLVLDDSPAVQACARLGLPADYLYQSRHHP
ncbi:MAG: DUF2236 domain-containing protein [Rubrivivax sp.]|nr:MAG: DUF2236 domain-containing protein [Rubrivivax sp.]